MTRINYERIYVVWSGLFVLLLLAHGMDLLRPTLPTHNRFKINSQKFLKVNGRDDAAHRMKIKERSRESYLKKTKESKTKNMAGLFLFGGCRSEKEWDP